MRSERKRKKKKEKQEKDRRNYKRLNGRGGGAPTVGFLDAGGGIGGFFPIGGGGLGLDTAISGVECEA